MNNYDQLLGIRGALGMLQLQESKRELLDSLKMGGWGTMLKYNSGSLDVLSSRNDHLRYFADFERSTSALHSVGELREVLLGIEALPFSTYRESLQALVMHDPLSEYRRIYDKYNVLDPIQELRDGLRSLHILDPLKEYRDALEASRVLSDFSGMNSTFKSLGIESIIKYATREEWSAIYSYFDDKVELGPDNTISLGSATFSCAEIQRIADEIADKIFSDSSERIEQVLERLIAEVKALKSPVLEKILTLFVFPIIMTFAFSFINSGVDYYVKNYLTAPPREVEKKIKKHVISEVEDRAVLEKFRLVSGKAINVRLNPSANSPVVGQFQLGQVVALMEKRGDWSLVAWSDDGGGVVVRGWVFSRYLKKFN
ncbi:SH3 domain-containing protein [Burkholderiaceae bacterium DAT-1]|nr:SH3 domain-containing protein [Burkholderiaceae bacterium DAT-1]